MSPGKPISLHPLSFEEALSGLLKVPPPEKSSAKKKRVKKKRVSKTRKG